MVELTKLISAEISSYLVVWCSDPLDDLSRSARSLHHHHHHLYHHGDPYRHHSVQLRTLHRQDCVLSVVSFRVSVWETVRPSPGTVLPLPSEFRRINITRKFYDEPDSQHDRALQVLTPEESHMYLTILLWVVEAS